MRGLSRIGGEDALWHVMNRSAHRVQIFTSEGQYGQFVSLLRTFTKREGLAVAAYCVMPNHYHVLVRGAGERLTRCFHEVDRLWAISWNEFRDQKGHVFQGPFLSFLQHSAGWMVRTSAYIHLNPVPRLAARPEQYPWSSCGAYFGTGENSSWVDAGIVLGAYGKSLEAARAAYRDYLEIRQEWRSQAPEKPEEQVVDWTAARELALCVPRLETALRVSRNEASRLAARYGRRMLGLSVAVLSRSLGYGSAVALSRQLSKLRARLLREPGLVRLVERSEELLGG